VIDEKNYEMGYGLSKKKAEQDAARRTLDILNKTNNE
jgi:dsRNA-specific ribonuclease